MIASSRLKAMSVYAVKMIDPAGGEGDGVSGRRGDGEIEVVRFTRSLVSGHFSFLIEMTNKQMIIDQ